MKKLNRTVSVLLAVVIMLSVTPLVGLTGNALSQSRFVNPNGGIWNGSMQTQSFKQNYNTTKTIPVPTRTGYCFTRWTQSGTNGSLSSASTAATYIYGANNNVTETITAQWQANSYIAALDPAGGVCTIPAITVYMDEPFGVLPVPVREGFTFAGWFMDDMQITENTLFTAAENGTLTAHWTKDYVSPVLVTNATAVLDEERGFFVRPSARCTETALREQYFTVSGDGHLEIESDGSIGTGTRVKLVNDQTGEVDAVYTIVIFGDVSGDGAINSTDVTEIRTVAAKLAGYAPDSAQLLAADVTHDGLINSTDVTEIRMASAKLQTIAQSLA